MRINVESLKNVNPNMTIGEFVLNIENKNKEKEDKDALIRKTVIDHYTGKYIKIYEENGIFGESLKIYKIDLIKSVGYNTDYNELYGITGTKISFSKRDLAKYEIKGECGNSFSYADLQQATIIQYEQYIEYLDQYNTITTTLKQLIK